MSDRPTGRSWGQIPLVRQCLVVFGFFLIALTPLVGPIPGPGGIIVFGAGLSLVLKYTGWAKRLYVRFKRKHPNKGRWADWSLRRASARRREELRKQGEAGKHLADSAQAPSQASLCELARAAEERAMTRRPAIAKRSRRRTLR